MGDDLQAQAGSGQAMSQLADHNDNSGAQASREDVAARAVVSPMRVIERGVYRGAHLYSLTPMIRINLDLGSLE